MCISRCRSERSIAHIGEVRYKRKLGSVFFQSANVRSVTGYSSHDNENGSRRSSAGQCGAALGIIQFDREPSSCPEWSLSLAFSFMGMRLSSPSLDWVWASDHQATTNINQAPSLAKASSLQLLRRTSSRVEPGTSGPGSRKSPATSRATYIVASLYRRKLFLSAESMSFLLAKPRLPLRRPPRLHPALQLLLPPQHSTCILHCRPYHQYLPCSQTG